MLMLPQALRKHKVLGETVVASAQAALQCLPFGLGALTGALLGCIYVSAAKAAANTRTAARLLRQVQLVHRYLVVPTSKLQPSSNKEVEQAYRRIVRLLALSASCLHAYRCET